jgi:membrane-associated protease RseP (regulator of RpoE activity)
MNCLLRTCVALAFPCFMLPGVPAAAPQTNDQSAALAQPAPDLQILTADGQHTGQGAADTLYTNVVPQLALEPQPQFWFAAGNSYSGMVLAPVDESLAAQLKLAKDQGLIVTSLESHSPAAMAGIRQNDVLLKLGEKSLGKLEDLEEGLKAAGDKPVALSLIRGGSAQQVQVQPRVQVSLGPVEPEPPAFFIGVSVSSIEPALRAQLQLPGEHGLLAINVVKDSPAEKAGIQPHDILLSLNGKDLTSQARLIELVQSGAEKTIPLEVVREGKKTTLQVTPERRKKSSVSLNFGQPGRTFRYDVVRPGALMGRGGMGGTFGAYGSGPLPKGEGPLHTVPMMGAMHGWTATTPGNAAATSKRLDDLAAEVKALRQAVEALAKATEKR